jgi:biuret amidohydrolase
MRPAVPTAVLALHFQNDVLHPDGKVALGLARQPGLREQLIEQASGLFAGARARGLPVIAVRIAFRPDYADVPKVVPLYQAVSQSGAMAEGGWGSAFHAGFEPVEGDAVFTHNRANAFQGTGLADLLAVWKIERLILAGIATNSVVEHSARHAADLGFDVIAAEEACACARPDLHAAAFENIRLIGRVLPVATLIDRWGDLE